MRYRQSGSRDAARPLTLERVTQKVVHISTKFPAWIADENGTKRLIFDSDPDCIPDIDPNKKLS